MFRFPFFLIVLLAGACLPVASRPAAPRNVVFISCDDLNQELGCYGNEQVESPNIDRLADRGLRFRNAYAQWPSCLPSRVSFLSGWSPPRTRVWSFDFDAAREGGGPLADAIYFPEHFRNAGHTTARLDKVFHIGGNVPDCWDIDEEPYRRNGRFKAIWTGIEIKTLGLKDKVVAEGQVDSGEFPMYSGERALYQVIDDGVADEELFDGHTARRAVELLEGFAAEGESFLLAVGFRRPHLPWIAKERDFALYPPESIRLPPQQPNLEAEFPDPKHREVIAHYHAATTFVDRQVGKVIDALDRTGLAENTVVVLIGDHGYCLGERDNHFGKGRLWDLALRPAMIVATPDGRRAGEECRRPVALVDLYPTLVELCGLEAPGVPLDGRSLVPLLEAEDADWREAVFSYSSPKGVKGLETSVRTATHRYTDGADGTPRELYDHREDPYEWRNLVEDPEQAALIERLSALVGRGEAG